MSALAFKGGTTYRQDVDQPHTVYGSREIEHPVAFFLDSITTTSTPIRLSRSLAMVLRDSLIERAAATTEGLGLSDALLRELVATNRPQDVTRIRESANLTVSEVGVLFGVSRRSVHNWLDGGAMSRKNDTRLRRLVEFFDQQSVTPEELRRTLMTSSEGEPSAFDWLVRELVVGPPAGSLSPADRFSEQDRVVHEAPVYEEVPPDRIVRR